MARNIERIILHCSDSPYGNVALIDEWHRKRGFDRIGYHFVILNGYPTEQAYRLKQPQFWLDGTAQIGRPVEAVGAHAKGYNRTSVGICLIGKRLFTMHQFETVSRLIRRLRSEYPDSVLNGHYELASDSRTCPNIDMDWLRELV